eukprot:759364-Hanusia_phi.AAC.10
MARGVDVCNVSFSSYRKEERGWLACAGNLLFFRSHTSPSEDKGRIFIIDKESLQETGAIEKFQSSDVDYGPILGDGSMLYSVKRSENMSCSIASLSEIESANLAVTSRNFLRLDDIVSLDARDGSILRTIKITGPSNVQNDLTAGEHSMQNMREDRSLTKSSSTSSLSSCVNAEETQSEGDGSVFACGQNRKGELGHSTFREEAEMSIVQTLRRKRVVKVAAGSETSYFLTDEGK